MSSPPAATMVAPRACAVLVRWALRYSAGRLTGVYSYPMAIADLAGERLTSAERAAILKEAKAALAAAVYREGDVWNDHGEPEAWRRFVARIDALDGEGSDEPIQTHGGRSLALTASGAVRCLTGYGAGAGDDEIEAVAAAIAQVAQEFSDSDRVLIMRDLNDHASAARADAGAPDVNPVWAELYGTLAQMPLDEDYARRNRLPESIG